MIFHEISGCFTVINTSDVSGPVWAFCLTVRDRQFSFSVRAQFVAERRGRVTLL